MNKKKKPFWWPENSEHWYKYKRDTPWFRNEDGEVCIIWWDFRGYDHISLWDGKDLHSNGGR